MQHAATTERTDRDALIEAHMDMAVGMARRMARRLPANVSCEDLESAALLGLTEAACRYDDKRREPFMGFATKRIRGAILDHLRRTDMLTRRGRRAARRVAETARELEAENGRAASDSEIAERLGMTDCEFQSAYARVREVSVISVDELDALPHGPAAATPIESIDRQQIRAALGRALARLDERARVILACYYLEGLTMREIGQVLGVTESRVCQIHSQALALLREQLA